MAKREPNPVDESHPVVRALRWILANRKDEQGERWNEPQLSLAAGLTRGHVEQILEGRQTPNIKLQTAIGLARAGKVSLEWFMTGEGAPVSFPRPDDLSEDERGVIAARMLGYPEHDIQAVLKRAAEGGHGARSARDFVKFVHQVGSPIPGEVATVEKHPPPPRGRRR